MSEITRIYRSTPLDDLETLYSIYGTRDRSRIPFLVKLDQTTRILKELLIRKEFREYGVVLAIEGTWGSGKTSFVSLLMQELQDENIASIKFDSLFYGSVSEASEIFIENLFEEIKEVFGISLQNGNILSDNLSPRLELNNGIPRFSLDFIKKRKSVEVVKEQLSDKLRRISGKVVVVIDDLDRVASKDIVHFLRIVRVLRELPNFIVILPIDRRAIENLLGREIEHPGRYLHKLIDESINLDSDVISAQGIYDNQVANYANGLINPAILNKSWEMILWSIIINVLDSDTVRETGVVMGTDKNDMNWSNLERKIMPLSGNSNIVRAIYQKLMPEYGGVDNYVARIDNNQTAQNGSYQITSYRNLRSILSQSNISSILLGRANPIMNPNEYLQNQQTIDIMTTQWWKDSESMINNHYNANGSGQVLQDYELHVPIQEMSGFNQTMNEQAVTIWDEIHGLAAAYYPYEAAQHLAPRSIYKICAKVDFDFIASLNLHESSRSEDLKPVFEHIKGKVREVVNQA